MGAELRILGQIAFVDAAGSEHAVPRPNQRRFLARLACHSGAPLPSERLADELDLSAGGLRTRVRRVRQIVGEETILTEANGYRLGAVSLDADRFVETRRRAAAVTGAASIALYRSALSMWTGEALAEFAHEPWAAGEAARLNELRASTLDDLADVLISGGSFAEAIAELEVQIAREPYRDRSRRLQMTALHRSGRTVEALRAYQVYREFLVDETGTEPSPETQELERAIATNELPSAPVPIAVAPAPPKDLGAPTPDREAPPGETGRSNVPVVRPELIGRDEILADLVARLDHTRLITLVAPGGAGKSALAVETAGQLVDRFPDGTFVVELASVSDGRLVPAAIADAVGLRAETASMDLARLCESLRDRSMLLVIDNAEHLLDDVAETVEAILARHGPTMLVTSREWLDVPGEQTVHIPALYALGPGGRSFGAELFLSNAKSAGVAVDDLHLDDVEALCRRLDFLPLAIELAAGSAVHQSPTEILNRLERGEGLAGRRRRNRSRRFTSTEEMVAHSFELLDEDERSLMFVLSSCRGPTPLDAIDHIAGEVDVRNVTSLLGSLVARNLVATAVSATGDLHYRLLETVRDHVRDRADEAGRSQATRRAHRDWFLAWSMTASPLERFAGSGRAVRLEPHLANFREAMRFSLDADDSAMAYRQATELTSTWFTFLNGEEGLEWLDASVGDDVDEEARVHYLVHALSMAIASQRFEFLGLVGELGERCIRVETPESVVGLALWALIQPGGSQVALETMALAEERDRNLGSGLSPLVGHLRADLHLSAGDFEAAFADYERTARSMDEGDFAWWVSAALVGAALSLHALGRLDEGLVRAERSLQVAASMPDVIGGVTRSVAAVTTLLAARGRLDEACARLLEEIERTEARTRSLRVRCEPLAAVLHLAIDLGDRAFAAKLLRFARDNASVFRSSPWQSALLDLASSRLSDEDLNATPVISIDEAVQGARSLLRCDDNVIQLPPLGERLANQPLQASTDEA